jgi:NADH dehydrogenase FAD-containing subunit
MPQHAPKGFVPFHNIFGEAGGPQPPLPTPPATPTRPPASSRHAFIQGQITSISAHSVQYLLPGPNGYDGLADDGSDAPPERMGTVEFDYLVYALGAGLPAPCDVWGEYGRKQLCGRGSKAGGVAWMQARYEVVKAARSVCVVGAGALGIRESSKVASPSTALLRKLTIFLLSSEFSSDIKDLWPDKMVTLIHSRTRMLPRYPPAMHDAVIAGLERVGVQVILGERVVAWSDPSDAQTGLETVTTEKGRRVSAEIVLACTGPRPHSELMRALEPRAIAPNGRIRVKETMQVDVPERDEDEELQSAPATTEVNGVAKGVSELTLNGSTQAQATSHGCSTTLDLDHMFVIGDSADTTAIMAGHTAYWQGEVAARNIQHLIESESGPPELDESEEPIDDDSESGDVILEPYTPGPPAIKVTLGITRHVIASGDSVTVGEDGVEDLQARLMWPVFGVGECGDDE